MQLQQKVLKILLEQQLIRKGSSVLVGVSGGIDSVVLLHILHSIRHCLSVQLSVGHFNHKLRKSADRDQKLVEKLAHALNIPIYLGINDKIKTSKIVSEDQARKWRFNFFNKVMKKSSADVLVLAHNQNDQAETVLMRILRGTGLLGVRGIKREISLNGMRIVRPLISFSRDEITEYAKLNNISYCEDESNDSNIYLRNKIRNELIPILKREYNPNVVSSISQLAISTGDDYDVLLEYASTKFSKHIQKSVNGIRIKVLFFQTNHVSIMRLAIRKVYEEMNGNLNQISFENVEMAISFALNARIGSKRKWFKNIIIRKSDKFVEFCQ